MEKMLPYEVRNIIGKRAGYVFFSIMVLTKALGLGSSDKLYYILSLIAGVFWCLNYVSLEITKSQLVFTGCIMSLAVVTTFVSRGLGFLVIAMTIICMRNIDINKVLKLYLLMCLIGFVIMTTLASVGVIEDVILQDSREQGLMRHCMGYSHANMFHAFYTIIVGIWVYLRKEKLKIVDVVILFGLNFVMFYFSGSLTGSIIAFLMVIAIFVCKYIEKNEKAISILCILMSLFNMCILCMSFIYPIVTDAQQNWGHWYSTVVHRFALTNEAIKTYPITLFGIRNIDVMIDNAYVYFFYKYGIVPFIIVIGIFVVGILYLVKENRLYDYAIVTVFVFYGFFEQFFNTPFMNFSWLIIGSMFMRKFIYKENTIYDGIEEKGISENSKV